jgi:hypothetical protein
MRLLSILGLAALLTGCETSSPTTRGVSLKSRDINAVLAAHDQQIVAMPGVAGIYVGLLDDGVTPCLKVMLVRRDPKLEQAIPRELEGYLVITEVTGEIRPLGTK